ncbi:N-acetylneuraminate synthase family protein [Paenibacillus sp. 1011MAR3C5]|uniref:N-acetylneuraminate synthase family protein n=1 Tax=Paenibacillus sp. 1011MAR3C5 TaxID=1675787 RepID=UPI0021759AAF|nr:N-acetylneuraminate synthase family protein [Paenibacillus sp. 1011MAR3C5]
MLQSYVTLLHCTTQYPAPVNSINLNSINEMQKIFQLPKRFSDYSEGIYLPMVAVGMGAKVVESTLP